MERKQQPHDTDHLIFLLSNQLYALPYHDLVQIIDSPKATALPHMDDHVRGAVNFHGEMIVLYDLRKAFGLPSLSDEVSATVHALAQRKQDHINWLDTLKDEVYHDKEITVQTDPHKCAFGKWYDRFSPESTVLAKYMARFDAPHRKIHSLAVKAQELIHAGRKEQARDMILHAERAELNALISLFDNAEQAIRAYTYEYAVVIEKNGSKFGVTVDAVRSFERIDEINTRIPSMLMRACGDFLLATGRRAGGGKEENVLIVDVVRVVGAQEMSLASRYCGPAPHA